VVLEERVGDKVFRTVVTLERSLAGVVPHVDIQRRFLREALLAKITLVGFFFGVNPRVRDQKSLRHKLFTANLTNKILLSGVYPPVVLERLQRRQTLAAHVTNVTVKLSVVFLHVSLEVAMSVYHFATNFASVDFRDVSLFVASEMDAELSLVGQSFGAVLAHEQSPFVFAFVMSLQLPLAEVTQRAQFALERKVLRVARYDVLLEIEVALGGVVTDVAKEVALFLVVVANVSIQF
jgi:hypothetical protein